MTILYLGEITHYHMHMILIKDNRLKLHAGHTSQQLDQHHLEVATNPRIQDPARYLHIHTT